ncbi:MAG: pilin [Bacillota bacterium]
MSKRLFRWMALFLLVMIALLTISAVVYAEPAPNPTTGDPGLSGTPQSLVDFLVKILRWGSALGGLIVAGAYMLNGYRLAMAHDPRKRAEASEALISTTVGAVVAFAAYGIAGVLHGLVAGG